MRRPTLTTGNELWKASLRKASPGDFFVIFLSYDWLRFALATNVTGQ